MRTVEDFGSVTSRLTLNALVALALACGTAQSAAAQAGLLGPGAGFLTVGAARISTGGLDEWLDERGYPTFGRSAVSIGLGGYRLLSSGVMLGADAQGFIIGDAPHEEGRMGLGGGYATVGIGYAVELSPRVRLYPRLGFGAGGMALWIESEDTLAFEDVLEEEAPAPSRDPNLARDGVVLDLGAGTEFLPGGRNGLLIGVRAGWLAGPFTDRWEMYEHEVSGGPDASISGPYLRVVVGWAWRR